ncbi:MAG: PAS domain S-box protein [Acidaminobacteraceae bacterium]
MKKMLENIKDEMLYKVFVENHPSIIMIIDGENGRIMDANIAAEKFYGYSNDEFIGKNVSEINTYSKEEIYLEMKMAIDQNRNFLKFTHRLKDGSLKKVNVISYPIVYNKKEYLFSVVVEEIDQFEFLDDRSVNLIQGFLFDKPVGLDTLFERMNNVNQKSIKYISSETEKEILENTFYNTGRIFVQNSDENFKFKNSNIQFSGIIKSYVEAFYKSPVGMILVSDDFKIQRWNKSATDIFGYKMSEVIGENLLDLTTKEASSKGFYEVFKNAFVGGNHEAVIDNVDCHNNDLKCQWNINLISDTGSLEKTYICIIQNITEKIELEKECIKINNALNKTKSAIVMTDLEGKITYVNSAFMEITGYIREEILNENINLVSSNEQSDEFYNELWNVINDGKIWSGEFKNKKKNGDLYWTKANIYPVIEEDRITGFISIQLDLSDEKNLIDANEDLKLKLYEQDKIASLGLLTTGIMHEINNPLSYIQGNVNYLLEEIEKMSGKELDIHEEFKETLIDVAIGVKQIKDIADGLKKYIFKDKSESPVEVDIVDVINEVLKISKNEYKYYANIKFEYDKKNNYLVLGFASKLKQVIMNLIINSSHAIAEKKMQSLGLINIQLENLDEYVEIRFLDNGIGINEEILKKIFEAFFTTKKSGVGSGLGLSITKDIIENDHNGSIYCESEVGVGTNFIIKIPKYNK